MAQILVRNLDEDLKQRLRQRAAAQGRSMEDEVRHILRLALADSGQRPRPLGSAMAARFANLGLSEDLPELRGEAARPADLG